MTDQCKHCTMRGNIVECLKTECFVHQSWFVKTILDTSHRDRESTLNKLFHAELAWFNPPHKEDG